MKKGKVWDNFTAADIRTFSSTDVVIKKLENLNMYLNENIITLNTKSQVQLVKLQRFTFKDFKYLYLNDNKKP